MIYIASFIKCMVKNSIFFSAAERIWKARAKYPNKRPGWAADSRSAGVQESHNQFIKIQKETRFFFQKLTKFVDITEQKVRKIVSKFQNNRSQFFIIIRCQEK